MKDEIKNKMDVGQEEMKAVLTQEIKSSQEEMKNEIKIGQK